jgi:hypothetical protein
MSLIDPKEFREFAKSHRFVKLLYGVILVVFAIVIFEAGIAVGLHKASFAYGWEQSYGQNFGDPRGQFGFPGAGLPIAHGADGKIISINGTSFIVANDDEIEKTIFFATTTMIRDGRVATSASALKNGSYVVIIGDPTASGTVSARYIRILPPPEDTLAY